MHKRRLLLPLGALVIAGCTSAPPAAPAWTLAPPSPNPSAGIVENAVVIDVYKSPSCGCCHAWEAYLRSLGYTVRSVPTEDMATIKADHGLPQETWSCHTAVVDGYVVEGHVPVEAIRDLLANRPAIDGIALPGMPAGSPGMPGEKAAPFEILAISDGTISDFGAY
ncbi:MAG: DUF411 domain-containing protein [Chloroflexota bacterium]